MRLVVFLLVALCLDALAQDKAWSDVEETSEYWNEMAQEDLKTALERQTLNKLVAKNVIMFLGDGMSLTTITAGRILKGQMKNQTGEEYVLAMEKFPNAALSKTYSVDRQTTDSAATATAYLCGVKSKYGTIGLSGGVERLNCESSMGRNVDSILVDSFKEGKATGLISTVHIAHASPAGTYAHTPERNWYSDSRMTTEAKDAGCRDIAQQFYDYSDMITVALGGGRQFFRPTTVTDEVYTTKSGERRDGQDLIQQWLDDGSVIGENRQYVWDRNGLENIDPVQTDRLLGLFETEGMNYEVDRDPSAEPSLAEMVEASIRILRKNEKGYFLFVEGGKIDQGHHDASAIQALVDMVAFDDAIDKALDMTSDSDTLIVVTADHSHTMSLGAYTWRGSPILGTSPSADFEKLGEDEKPYTALLYNNGPGYQGGFPLIVPQRERENLTGVDTGGRSYKQQSAVPHTSESHGGDDVAILARGPMAHLFHGVHEQHYIPHAMRYASCVGSNKGHCTVDDQTSSSTSNPVTSTSSLYHVSFLALDLTATNALIALYVQFVLVICLATFIVCLGILVMRSSGSNTKGYIANATDTHKFGKSVYENGALNSSSL